MPADLESVPAASSLICWSPSRAHEISLESFLTKNNPETTRTPKGGDGWIWVTIGEDDKRRAQVKPEAVEKGKELLKALEERLETIKTDSAIPSRKSKTGGPTKAELKQQAILKAKKDLEDTAVKGGWTCGKWLFFESPGYASWAFSRLATSIIDGPLSKLKARPHTVKVSTTDGDAMGHNQGREDKFLVCLYFDNIWDEDDAKEVLTCVLREHGDKPSAAKSDFYTLLDITSKHPSGLRSSQWQPGELINPSIIEEWVTEGRERRRAADAEKRGDSPGKERKRRTVAEDAFEDEDEGTAKSKRKGKGKSKSPVVERSERDAAKDDKEEKVSPAMVVEAPKPAPSELKAENEAAPKASTSKPKPSKDEVDERSDTEDDEEPVLLPSSSSRAKPKAKPAPAPASDPAPTSSAQDDGAVDEGSSKPPTAGTKRSAPASSGDSDGTGPSTVASASAKEHGASRPAQRKKVDKYGRGAF